MVPDWVKQLAPRDEVLLYFPYTGNYCQAEVIKHEYGYQNILIVQYVWKGKVKSDELNYENYTNDASSYDNWIAYRMS